MKTVHVDTVFIREEAKQARDTPVYIFNVKLHLQQLH